MHDITCTLRDAGQKAGDILNMLESERQRKDERARRERIEDGERAHQERIENDERAHRERIAHERIHVEQQDHGQDDQSQQRLIDPRIRQASVSSRSSRGARQRGIDLEVLRNEPDSVHREEGYLQRIAELEERLAAARGSSSEISGSSVASRSSSRGYCKRRRDIDDLGTIQEEVKPPARPQTPEMLAPPPAQDLRGIIDLTLSDNDDENRDELESDSTHEANIP